MFLPYGLSVWVGCFGIGCNVCSECIWYEFVVFVVFGALVCCICWYVVFGVSGVGVLYLLYLVRCVLVWYAVCDAVMEVTPCARQSIIYKNTK